MCSEGEIDVPLKGSVEGGAVGLRMGVSNNDETGECLELDEGEEKVFNDDVDGELEVEVMVVCFSGVDPLVWAALLGGEDEVGFRGGNLTGTRNAAFRFCLVKMSQVSGFEAISAELLVLSVVSGNAD